MAERTIKLSEGTFVTLYEYFCEGKKTEDRERKIRTEVEYKIQKMREREAYSRTHKKDTGA